MNINQNIDQQISVDDVLDLARNLLKQFFREDLILKLTYDLRNDIEWMFRNDPASENTEEILSRSTTIAVAYYRLANLLYYTIGGKKARKIALNLQQKSKQQTQIDIHPGAKINVPFAMDHGTGTVIGSTTEIGQSCLILNDVTLGAVKTGSEAGEMLRGKKRHPSIGNCVKIASHVRILGPVRIGDNCDIGSYALVKRDIPPKTKISCVAKLQIVTSAAGCSNAPPVIFSVSPSQNVVAGRDAIYIKGQDFDPECILELIYVSPHAGNNEDGVVPIQCINVTSNSIQAEVDWSLLEKGRWDVRVSNPDQQSYCLPDCIYNK